MNEDLIELKLSDRDSSRELQEQRATEPAASSELASFGARLLALVSDTVVESDNLRTYEFRSKLEKYRHRLANSVDGDPNTAVVASDCLRLCQDYLNRARSYLLDRESEFAEVIEVMRTALARLAGEANSFTERLMGSSERFNRLTEIDDIRELKQRIAEEVRDLNRVVVEKQRQDEVSYAQLSRRIVVLQINVNHTSEEASVDALTGISDRGSFDRALEQWTYTHRENHKPFVLAMLDLDDFKQINDTHGHQVGDRVLYCAAQWFGKYVRATDFLGRYGGEEFVVMMAEINLSLAQAKFVELLGKIAGSNYVYRAGEEERIVSFTASCGLAEFSGDESAEELLRRADEALYVAKRTGKNRVVLAKKTRSLWQTLKPFRKS